MVVDAEIKNAARCLGKKGGSASSPAKTRAVIANAKKPRGKLVTVIAYRGKDASGKERFGATVEKGRLNTDQQFDAVCLAANCWAWADCEMAAQTKRLVL